MLMAAGLGTRLRPFSSVLPKPLLPVLGIPVAQFAIDHLVAAGVDRLVANYHHLPEVARQGLSGLDYGAQTRLTLSDESTCLLGSAGGLRRAMDLFGDGKPFFLMNADVLTYCDLGQLQATHRRLRSRWGVSITLALLPHAPLGSRGEYREIRIDPRSERIVGLGESRRDRPFFMGVAILEPEALQAIPAGRAAEFVPEILLPAIEKGQAGFYLSDDLSSPWIDIGSPRLWRDAHFELMSRLETGRGIPKEWRERVEAKNHRRSERCWSANSAASVSRRVSFVANAYLGAENDSGHYPAHGTARGTDSGAVRGDGSGALQLGPDAVHYGALTQSRANGVGFQELWSEL